MRFESVLHCVWEQQSADHTAVSAELLWINLEDMDWPVRKALAVTLVTVSSTKSYAKLYAQYMSRQRWSLLECVETMVRDRTALLSLPGHTV